NGAEFRINTTTADSQEFSSISTLSDGGFIVTWQSRAQDVPAETTNYGIYAQRYDASGTKVGGEFLVNDAIAGSQTSPAVSGLDDGYVIAWTDASGQDGDGSGIFMKVYKLPPTSETITDDTRINTYRANNQEYPDIAKLSDGGSVVAWQSDGQDGGNYGVYAQRYDVDGNTIGNEFQVNTETTSYQWRPSVAGLTGGGFVIAWETYGQDGDGYGVYTQLYDASGNTVGNEFLVNTYITSQQKDPSVAALTGGGFVIAWESRGQDRLTETKYGIYYQMYDASGNTVGSELRANTYTINEQWNPSAAPLSDGGFVITWHSETQDGDLGGVYFQRFNATGVKIGGELKANTFITGVQDSPAATGLAGGGFVITWNSQNQDGSLLGIYAQLYNASGTAVGSEFLVNTETTGYQANPRTTALTGGGFVITWHSNGQDGDGYGIYAQRFDASATPVGNEFQANTYTTSSQIYPAVAPLADDGLAITWMSYLQDGAYYGVYMKRFEAPPISELDIQVNTTVASFQYTPDIATLDDGGIVVAWQAGGQDGSGQGIYAQRYDADGNTAGSEFQVNNYTASDQITTSVAALDGGGFVIAWSSYLQDGNNYGVYAQRYDASGAEIGIEFKVNTYFSGAQQHPSVAPLPGGGFVIAWSSQYQDTSSAGVYFLRFDSNGIAIGSELKANTHITGNQWHPSVAVLASGEFVIAWESIGQDVPTETTNYGIFAQRFDTSGTHIGSEFPVNTYESNNQRTSSIAALAGGGFVITWESYGQDGDSYGIYAQLYDASGTAVGNEFRVNTEITSYQQTSSVTALTNGGFIITWESYGQDGDGYGIYAQEYGAFGNTVGEEFQVNTYTTNVQRFSSATALPNNGYTITWTSNEQDGDSYGIYMKRVTREPSTGGETPVTEGQETNTGEQEAITEENVNTTRNGDQITPVVEVLKDKSFVVVWQDDAGNDGDGAGVYAQMYNANGTRKGSEFIVSDVTAANQRYPDMAPLTGGGFVVTWSGCWGCDGSTNGVYARQFDASGDPITNKFQVNTYTSDSQQDSTVTGLFDGGYIITWTSEANQDGSSHGVYAQRFDSFGNKVGAEFQVNTYTADIQNYPAIATLSNGWFVITWQSENQDGDAYGTYAQIFDINANRLGSEFRVNTITAGWQYQPKITALNDGKFAILHTDDSSRKFQIFDKFGNKLVDDTSYINSNIQSDGYHDIEALNDGTFLISVTTEDVQNTDGDGEAVWARRYNDQGIAISEELLVNEYTTGNQSSPNIATTPDGIFIIVWQSEKGANDNDISMRRWQLVP
ncbi:MAG: hypothetical protein GY804_08490, partial [Alphaproteobacteria bacterium]|nr:hypothetical protein [Alphaproteobacteria bacterium]